MPPSNCSCLSSAPLTARKKIDLSRRAWRLYFGLPVAAALLALALVFAAPSQGASAWLLGLSLARWGLVLALALAAGAFGWLALRSADRPSSVSRALEWARQPAHRLGLALCFAIVGVAALYLCLLTFKFEDAFVAARLQRLLPLFLFIAFLCIHNLAFLSFRQDGQQDAVRRLAGAWAVAFALLALFALTIGQTGVGLTPDRTGWDNPGVPLLGTQVLLACCVAAALLWLLSVLNSHWPAARTDVVICAVLWLVATLAWQAQPLQPTFFSPRPVAPTNEFFPYSDAATHDLIAQNVMVGEGFIPAAEKPLYSFFLAGLHSLVGQDYLGVVNAQILVLALLTVALYLIATRMHHRYSGALLALMVILRERNTIALGGQIGVSHSKLLMTDLPTALALAALSLLLLRWLSADRRSLRWPLLAGAALGAVALLRSQSMIFLPLLLLLAFGIAAAGWRSRLKYAGVLLLGFFLFALPWMVRNGFESGQFGFSQPLQGLYLAKQYSLTPEANDPGFPPDTPPSQYAQLGFASVLRFTREHPAFVAQFITAHFLHNEVSSFLALPLRFDLADKLVQFYNLQPYWVGQEGRLWSECCSLDSYIAQTPYWQNWQGEFPADAWLPIVFNVGMISLGLAAAWKRLGWAGLLPAGLHLVYNLSTAIARVSGWRLNLPVDWALLLYYAMGLGQLGLWLWAAFAPAVDRAKTTKPRPPKAQYGWRAEGLTRVSAVLLLAGLVMPLAELAIPARYAPLAADQAAQQWRQGNLGSDFDAAAFLSQPQARALVGRALWPRYYGADAGEPGGQWPAFNPLPFARLGFVLVGPQGAQVVLPAEQAPDGIRNAADVLVFACQRGDYLEAVALMQTSAPAQSWLSNRSTTSCE